MKVVYNACSLSARRFVVTNIEIDHPLRGN